MCIEPWDRQLAVRKTRGRVKSRAMNSVSKLFLFWKAFHFKKIVRWEPKTKELNYPNIILKYFIFFLLKGFFFFLKNAPNYTGNEKDSMNQMIKLLHTKPRMLNKWTFILCFKSPQIALFFFIRDGLWDCLFQVYCMWPLVAFFLKNIFYVFLWFEWCPLI